MGNLNRVIKIRQEDYDSLIAAYPSSITIGTTSLTWDENDIYLIDKDRVYKHDIVLHITTATTSANTDETMRIYFSIISSKPDSYDVPSLGKYLDDNFNDQGDGLLPASGYIYHYADSTANRYTASVYGLTGYDNSIIIYGQKIARGSSVSVGNVSIWYDLRSSDAVYDIITPLN